ncbi:MAG: redoxin domain-containing protein [Saprospiraceae bacterium]
MNTNKLFAMLSFCLVSNILASQSYEIKVKILNYNRDTLLFGYHYGDKQYIKDTAFRKNNEFVFKKDTVLEPGMYLVVTQPEHDFFQILIDKDKQKFSIETKLENLTNNLKFKGSKLNTDFLDYVSFVSKRRADADSIGVILKLNKDTLHTKFLGDELKRLDKEVKAHQDKLIKEQGTSILGLLIKSTKEVEVPEFKGTEEEKSESAFKFYKAHYFDYTEFKDDRIIRLPFFHSKVEKYLTNLTSQHPDSINVELDYVLGKCDEKKEVYRYLLSTQLSSIANSKYVGMDGVYVHLVENYYEKGKAPWIDKESLAKILRDAHALKPLLIDKIAPDFVVFKKDSTPITLHSVQADYTVLLIWAPDCGHCKKSMPGFIDFYNKYKSKGVEIFAVCNKTGVEEGKCWDDKEIKMGDWINTSDPKGLSSYKYLYDVKSTPQVYILDKNKKILTKKISSEQLSEVMDKIIKLTTNEAHK